MKYFFGLILFSILQYLFSKASVKAKTDAGFHFFYVLVCLCLAASLVCTAAALVCFFKWAWTMV